MSVRKWVIVGVPNLFGSSRGTGSCKTTIPQATLPLRRSRRLSTLTSPGASLAQLARSPATWDLARTLSSGRKKFERFGGRRDRWALCPKGPSEIAAESGSYLPMSSLTVTGRQLARIHRVDTSNKLSSPGVASSQTGEENMKRRRYQYGCLIKKNNKLSEDVWQFRYYETTPEGRRCRRSTSVGAVAQYPTKTDALRVIEPLRLRLNLHHRFGRPVSVGALVDRYVEQELGDRRHSTQQSHWSTRTAGFGLVGATIC
jgi:hypothetical protein